MIVACSATPGTRSNDDGPIADHICSAAATACAAAVGAPMPDKDLDHIPLGKIKFALKIRTKPTQFIISGIGIASRCTPGFDHMNAGSWYRKGLDPPGYNYGTHQGSVGVTGIYLGLRGAQ